MNSEEILHELPPIKSARSEWFFLKFLLLIVFIAVDIYLNSKAEYETLAHQNSSMKEVSQLQMLLVGGQVLLQMSIASVLFLLLCDTLPFQVGLWGGILKATPSLRLVLFFDPLYIMLGCAVGGWRLHQVSLNGAAAGLRKNGVYSTFSLLHKLVAPCYYAANLRSALSLFHSKYYSKEAWIPPAATGNSVILSP